MPPGDITPTFDSYEDDDTKPFRVPDIDDVDPVFYDNYVGAQVTLPVGDEYKSARVVRRKRDIHGNVTGVSNPNSILDTRTYDVELPDGSMVEYSANTIAENMYAMCDPEGNQHTLLEAIVDHKSDGNAVQKPDRYIEGPGNKHLKKTTAGWHLCIEWHDGSTSWERLADLKESYPVQVAEYAVSSGINDEPAFAWWVPYVFK